MPDIPTQLPLTYCSQACRGRVADAARNFLDHITDPQPEGAQPCETRTS